MGRKLLPGHIRSMCKRDILGNWGGAGHGKGRDGFILSFLAFLPSWGLAAFPLTFLNLDPGYVVLFLF